MKYVRITRRIFGMLGLRMREGALMVGILVLYATLEGFGIGLLLPVLQYMESGGQNVPTGGVWPYLQTASDALGIPINLATLLLMAFLPILLRQFVFYVNTWYTTRVQNAAIEKLTTRAFSAVVHADLSFIDTQDQGQLLSFLTGQIGRCGAALTTYLRLLSAVIIIAAYVVILSYVSLPLAVFSVAAALALSFAVRKILQASRRYGQEASDATNLTYSAIRQRVAAVRLVKMRAQEDAESARIGRLAAASREAATKIAVAGARIEVIVDPGLMLAVFVVIYFGVEGLGMTLSGLALYLFILLRLNAKSKEINLGRQQLAAQMPSFDFVENLLVRSEEARTIRGGAREFTGLNEAIELRDVHFSYGADGPEVLRGVDLVIRAGSMTALVGRSGAGKSTLVDMIPRLRVPTAGLVLADGVPLGEFDLPSLRKKIGFLTQEAILLNDTIRANLAYGLDWEPTDEQMKQALDDSYCSEFVDPLPHGIETKIGDRGIRFSGGQRQRLALARVLLQDPDILILDEPTSALDSESEKYIQQAFERIAQERTVVVIAHRLATVERAHRIVVLHEGEIAEMGTHSELLQRDGLYRRLFASQVHV